MGEDGADALTPHRRHGCEDGSVTPAPRAQPRSLRSRLPVEWPMIGVLALAVVGLLRVATAHWREGSVLLGGALLLAAALRAVLPADRAGLLAIRSRVVDILAYSGLGLAVVLLAVTITRGSLTVG
jgi:hypothetical protein